MAASAAAALGLDPAEVLVSSTGVIGKPLAMERVEAGIAAAAAALTEAGGEAAAEAIRTTDAYPKLVARTLELDGREVRIGGMAKGAGMIRPDMATTLAQVTTDAAVEPALLQALLREACDASFNCITVDGSTSTNDCILVLANGASGASAAGPGADELGVALADVLLDLALQVVADGEGTSRYCRWQVTGARDAADAQAAARTVAEDTLVRCALHGADPNWGRILAALGRAGIELDPARVAIAAGGVPLVERGEGVDGTEQRARAALARPAAEVEIDLGLGEACASVYGSALSPEYVRLNAEYTT
jgi:glutamate N-acetyltransferase/amino-acid N-acetyltransferase